MIILIPMGGHGSRFTEAGYTTNKACLPTIDRHSGKPLPMVVCAMKDVPEIHDPASTIICVDRDFHQENGTEDIIREHFPGAKFIHDHVLLDQAFGCFLAREYLQSGEELFIGACDNGMILDAEAFRQAREQADVIMISHSNDENIARNPAAHSWAAPEEATSRIKRISLKKPVSENYMADHATTGMFWFRRASDFLKYLEEMIWNKDTLDGKYYVDKVLQYCIDGGLNVQYFDVGYLCWGTPQDYENYQNTYNYWDAYVTENKWIGP